MHDLVFLGIILEGKEKFKTKRQKQYNSPPPPNFQVSHFAVETVGISMDDSWLRGGAGQRDSRAPAGLLQEEPQKENKRLASWGLNLSLSEKWNGMRVFQVFSAV